MAYNCINCGDYCSEMLSITPYGLAPVCGPECLIQINNSDTPLDRLQQMYLDNFKRCEHESKEVVNSQ